MERVIRYPDQGRYTYKGVSGSSPVEGQAQALGRNGHMTATGISVTRNAIGDPMIRLEPITSRGIPGRCCIEIPNDPATIEALCEALRQAVQGARPGSK